VGDFDRAKNQSGAMLVNSVRLWKKSYNAIIRLAVFWRCGSKVFLKRL
jgi:hypothetical protein